MKILPIFTEQNEGIYSVHYDGKPADALENLQNLWNDAEYLHKFFKANQKQLEHHYGDYTIQEAVLKTVNDAERLFNQLEDYAKSGFSSKDENLSDFFKPLHGNETHLPKYQASKAYGIQIKDSWLRLYALRLDLNTYIITGGGIKVVRAMQEDDLLAQELNSFSLVQEYLQNLGVIYPEDL